MTGTVTRCHSVLSTQVLGSTVVSLPVLLFFSTMVAYAWETRSWQSPRHHTVRLLSPVGTTRFWLTMESPRLPVFEPAAAARKPLCDSSTRAVVPEVAQPPSPFSNPPLITPSARSSRGSGESFQIVANAAAVFALPSGGRS